MSSRCGIRSRLSVVVLGCDWNPPFSFKGIGSAEQTRLKATTPSRWQNIKRLGSEAGWVFAGQILSLIGTLIGVRVLTEYLSPSVYGTLGLSLTVAALFNEVIIGGLIGAFTRFYSISAKAEDVHRYVRGVRFLLIVAAAIAVSLLLVLTPVLLSGYEGLTFGVGLVITLFAVLFGTSAALNAVLNGARRRSIVAFNSVIDAWLKIGLAVLAIHFFGASASAVLAAYAVSLFLILMHQIYRVRQLSEATETKGDRKWVREMLIFAWPASVWGIFTWAQQVADRWSLQAFYSSAEVGLYSVVLQLGYFPMTLLMGMLGTFLTPIFFQKTDDQHAHFSQEQNPWWRMVTLAGLGISILAALMAYLLQDLIFSLFVATEFQSVRGYLPVMVLSGGLFGLGSLLAVRLMAHMRMIQLGKIMVATSVTGVLIAVWLTSLYGLDGTVAGKLLFSAIYCGCLLLATKSGASK